MKDATLRGRKMDAYVLLKILKYCTDSPARSYQLKYAVDRVFNNKSIDSTEDIGTAIKKIIHYRNIRGKFSSVHPDLAAEGITRVEVRKGGLHFIRNNPAGECPVYFQFFMRNIPGKEIIHAQSVNEKDEEDKLVRLALEEHSRREEEILARDLKSTMLWHV